MYAYNLKTYTYQNQFTHTHKCTRRSVKKVIAEETRGKSMEKAAKHEELSG